METNVWRVNLLLLAWTTLIQNCICQVPLLTLIDDQCITNTSSAMAMIYDLSGLNYPMEEVSEIRSPKKDNGGIEGICTRRGCLSWFSNWYYVQSMSVKNVHDIITDRRWEYLPTYITKHTNNYGYVLDYQFAGTLPNRTNFNIPFSVQAGEEAHIFICDGDRVPFSNCYWFMLQAWDGHSTGFRKCGKYEIQDVYNGRAPTGLCKESTERWHHPPYPKFLNEDRWRHLKIVKVGHKYRLEHQNGSTILNVTTKNFPITPKYLFFHTKSGSGLWKVHNFTYFYSRERKDYDLTTRLTISKGQNCLAMFVVMCESCWMDIKFLSAKEHNALQKVTVDTRNQKWKEFKFIFNVRENYNDVLLRVSTKAYNNEGKFWAFDDLRSCDADEIRVLKPTYPQVWKRSCQLVENEIERKIDTRQQISYLENWRNCDVYEFGENCMPCQLIFNDKRCPANKYCQLIKEESGIEHQKCYCPSDTDYNKDYNDCRESCEDYTYGHGCKKSCEHWQGEKCDVPIYIFDHLPKIEIGSSSCNLTILSFSGKGSPQKPPKFYKFEYKEMNNRNWKDVIQNLLIFDIIDQVTLSNLMSNSMYSVRAFGFQTPEDLSYLEGISNVIPFITFRTTCEEIKESQIVINPDVVSAKISFNPYVEDLRHLCPLLQYSFTLNDTDVNFDNEYIIHKLEPYSEYILALKRNGNTLFTKNFRTSDSVPEKVEKFGYSSFPSGLHLQWSTPKKANGNLLFYTISFQVEKYGACEDVTNQELFKLFIPEGVEEAKDIYLEPYAQYRIEIRANTSAGFGPPVSITALIAAVDWVRPEEIPKLNSSISGSNKITFRFFGIPCDEMHGPIYIDTSLRGTEPWCDHTQTFNADKLKNSELVINGVQPFCHYNVTLKFYRITGRIEEEIPTVIETLEGAPNEIKKLEVTSKGSKHISLRWLPPSPPTGHLDKFVISECFVRYSEKCDTYPINYVVKPNPCKLWPDFYCAKLNLNHRDGYNIYTLKIKSKNFGSTEYSNTTIIRSIWADDKKVSDPPYGLSMEWTEDNHLVISWYHPNVTNGIISSFEIYVNGTRQKYKINSEDDYSLLYNTTVASILKLASYYIIEIVANNPAGDSAIASILGPSPPPMPEESEEHITGNEKSITINFENMKKYQSDFGRFLYVFISECGQCESYLKQYLDNILLTHHQRYNGIAKTDLDGPSHWDLVQAYDVVMEITNHEIQLDIGENSNNKYYIKTSTTYWLAFIWIHQHEHLVKYASRIRSVDTVARPNENILGGVAFYTVIILLSLLIIIFTYIKFKKAIHRVIEGVLGDRSNTTSKVETVYESQRPLPLNPYKNNRNSLMARNNMPDIICPGNPLFKTNNSRMVKLEHFRQYVRHAHESDDLSRQHNLCPKGPTRPWTYGVIAENRNKNRYNNLIAYDHSRVVLNKIEGDEYSDYINAAYIDGYQTPRAYIATQGPKKNTINDFWRMVWQENVTNIVILANIYEGGKKKTEQYWPGNGEELIFGDFRIQFIGSKIFANYEYRTFRLFYKYSKPREIGQLHFTAWPDHGVPLYSQSLVPVLEKMLTFRSNDFPIVVHCSAGVGRTGTVILCDICLRMAAAKGAVDVLAMMDHLRNQRANMVDNVQQFRLAHLVILDCLMGLRTNIPINQDFSMIIEKLFQNDPVGFQNASIASQLKYIRDCEWEDDAMKTVLFMDDEEMPMVPEKNRFPNILPDDLARVFLKPYPPSDPTSSSTYINAVRVDAFCMPGRFIVTQFPLPNTIGDFWRLVVEKDISVVVCLNDIPTTDLSCNLFFPVQLDEFSPAETILVKHVNSKTFKVYSILKFEITVTDPYEDPRIMTVEIIKYRGWNFPEMVPDHTYFVTFVEEVNIYARNSMPALITCYDGASASGLFIAMSFLIEQIKLEHSCDVCQAVRSIRTSRKQFTNSEEQLKFLYKASLLFVEEKFNQYSNMK